MADTPEWILSTEGSCAAPGLAEYSRRIVSKSVWSRPGLSLRDKSIDVAVCRQRLDLKAFRLAFHEIERRTTDRAGRSEYGDTPWRRVRRGQLFRFRHQGQISTPAAGLAAL